MLSPVPSSVPSGATGGTPVPPAVNADVPDLSLALEIHGKLSQIVAPANPRTIRASRLTGKYPFSTENTAVSLLLLVSIVSLAIFLTIAIAQAAFAFYEKSEKNDNGDVASTQFSNTTTTVSAQAKQPSSSNTTTTVSGQAKQPSSSTTTTTISDQAKQSSSMTVSEGPPSPMKSVMDILMLLAAASLGSAFYGLYTAHKYVVNCTFDPKYYQVYLIRFVLGLTSGTILGFFGKDFHLGLEGDTKKQLGASVLALVGGYAAEAVSQILQRIAEILVTVVRGSNTDALQAKEGESKAKAKQQETQAKNELVKGLLKAKEEAIKSQASPSVLEEIQKTIDSLSK